MKKHLFIALAAVGLLSSCSSEESVSSSVPAPDNDALQEIRIGLSAGVTTKGTGTVGDTASAVSAWGGQKVNIFMLKKDTIEVATFEDREIYNNKLFIAPLTGASGIAQDSLLAIEYYPIQGNFDFWGYRLDSANVINGAYQQPVFEEEAIKIPFVIDGSQDVMAGKAIPSSADSIAAAGQPNRIYSAYAARRDIQPNIVFNHLLTRFTFNVVAKDSITCDSVTGVYVTGISLVSKNTGKLVAAYTPSYAESIGVNFSQIEWDDALDTLSVKQRRENASVKDSLVALERVLPQWESTPSEGEEETKAIPTKVGEALLVAPQNEYRLIIHLQQDVKTEAGADSKETIDYTYVDKVKLSSGDGFKAGNSHQITITIYGLSDIKITTTLAKWEEGDEIELNPEDNVVDQED